MNGANRANGRTTIWQLPVQHSEVDALRLDDQSPSVPIKFEFLQKCQHAWLFTAACINATIYSDHHSQHAVVGRKPVKPFTRAVHSTGPRVNHLVVTTTDGHLTPQGPCKKWAIPANINQVVIKRRELLRVMHSRRGWRATRRIAIHNPVTVIGFGVHDWIYTFLPIHGVRLTTKEQSL